MINKLHAKNLKFKGYTLIELLAASAIFVGMMIIAVATFSVASSHEGTTSSRRLVNQSARTGVETMMREMSVSRNEYNDLGQIDPGHGAYMLADIDSNNRVENPVDAHGTPVNGDSNIPDQTNGPIKGNALIIFYLDKNNDRQTKAYYLCPHKDDPNFYSLGVQDLGFSTDNASFAQGGKWNKIKQAMDCNPNNWKQITSSDVIIEKSTDVSIEGYYPEQDLLVQPRLTISVKARNRLGARQADTFYSIYKTTTTHRDYASIVSP